MNDIDMVLVMSVNPGFGGQKFIPSALRKIKEVRQMEERLGAMASCTSISISTKPLIANHHCTAGANVIVAGSAVFGGDSEENVKKFLEHFASAN